MDELQAEKDIKLKQLERIRMNAKKMSGEEISLLGQHFAKNKDAILNQYIKSCMNG
jgi:hypothetical protein